MGVIMERTDIESADVDASTKLLVKELRSEIDSLKEMILELSSNSAVLRAQQAQLNYVLDGNNYEERWTAVQNAIENLKE
jgi:hypothetical protein